MQTVRPRKRIFDIFLKFSLQRILDFLHSNIGMSIEKIVALVT